MLFCVHCIWLWKHVARKSLKWNNLKSTDPYSVILPVPEIDEAKPQNHFPTYFANGSGMHAKQQKCKLGLAWMWIAFEQTLWPSAVSLNVSWLQSFKFFIFQKIYSTSYGNGVYSFDTYYKDFNWSDNNDSFVLIWRAEFPVFNEKQKTVQINLFALWGVHEWHLANVNARSAYAHTTQRA